MTQHRVSVHDRALATLECRQHGCESLVLTLVTFLCSPEAVLVRTRPRHILAKRCQRDQIDPNQPQKRHFRLSKSQKSFRKKRRKDLRQTQLCDPQSGTNDTRRTSHVGSHLLHARSRLQADSSKLEGAAPADKGKGLFRLVGGAFVVAI